jgi:hypothetical protein
MSAEMMEGKAMTHAEAHTSQLSPPELPFEANFTVHENYLFFGLASVNEKPPEMVPDPAFSPIPVAFNNLVLYRISDGPCGAFDWVCLPFLRIQGVSSTLHHPASARTCSGALQHLAIWGSLSALSMPKKCSTLTDPYSRYTYLRLPNMGGFLLRQLVSSTLRFDIVTACKGC